MLTPILQEKNGHITSKQLQKPEILKKRNIQMN